MKGIIWIASYPRSGNTWFRALVSNLMAAGRDPVSIYNLDSESFAARENYDRAIGWRTSEFTRAEVDACRRGVQEVVAGQGGPVLAKTHDVFRDPRDGRPLFSEAAARCAVYLVRNPLDVAVSIAWRWRVSYDEAVRFLNDPQAQLDAAGHHPTLSQLLGDWSAHVNAWVGAPGIRVMTVRYEDLLARPHETFAAACRFAQLPADPARVAQAVERSAFAALQKQEREKWRDALPPGEFFFRQGRQGAWRDELNAAQVEGIVARHRETMQRFGYLRSDGAGADEAPRC